MGRASDGHVRGVQHSPRRGSHPVGRGDRSRHGVDADRVGGRHDLRGRPEGVSSKFGKEVISQTTPLQFGDSATADRAVIVRYGSGTDSSRRGRHVARGRARAASGRAPSPRRHAFRVSRARRRSAATVSPWPTLPAWSAAIRARARPRSSTSARSWGASSPCWSHSATTVLASSSDQVSRSSTRAMESSARRTSSMVLTALSSPRSPRFPRGKNRRIHGRRIAADLRRRDRQGGRPHDDQRARRVSRSLRTGS